MMNLIDNKYGKLTVIKEGEKREASKYRYRFWTCLCSECGNTKDINQTSLLTGRSITCGCEHAERMAKMNRNRQCKLPQGEVGLNRIFRTYSHHAAERGYEFSLTKEQFRNLTKQNCFYCGIEPQQKGMGGTNGKQNTSEKFLKNSEYIYNGIDRLDNKIGYTTENCVACCGVCNRAKSDRDLGEFLDWVSKIYKNKAAV